MWRWKLWAFMLLCVVLYLLLFCGLWSQFAQVGRRTTAFQWSSSLVLPLVPASVGLTLRQPTPRESRAEDKVEHDMCVVFRRVAVITAGGLYEPPLRGQARS